MLYVKKAIHIADYYRLLEAIASITSPRDRASLPQFAAGVSGTDSKATI
jgi:hypothetical protein